MVDQPSLASRSAPTFWPGQATHFICLSLLLLLTWIAWQFIGNPSLVLFWIAIAFPILGALLRHRETRYGISVPGITNGWNWLTRIIQS